MIYFQGAAAFSLYRHQALLRRLQKVCPEITAFTAHFDYLVQTRGSLKPEELLALGQLLEAAPTTVLQKSAGLFWVTARRGTLSPWASKATDIAVICGLASVVRIERCYRYQMPGVSPGAQKIVYDPLTESVMEDPLDLAALFSHPDPAALASVALLEQGV